MASCVTRLLLSAAMSALGLFTADAANGSGRVASYGRGDLVVAKVATPWAEASTFPQSTAGLGDVSCVSSMCVAVGGLWGLSLTESHDGGKSWSNAAVPAGVTTLQSVSCASLLYCVAVGEYLKPARADTRQGVVVETNDGGNSWVRRATTTSGELVGVSCANAITCVAVGLASKNDGLGGGSFTLSTDNGWRSWATETIARKSLTLSAVSCPSPGACVAVGSTTAAGGSGNPVALVTADGGASWRTAALPGHDMALNSVSCPDTGRCVATGTSQPPSTAQPSKIVALVVTSNNGWERWTRQPLPAGAGAGTVVCLRRGWCLATGGKAPLLSRDYGHTWALAGRSAAFSPNVAAVACPTAEDCVAVGGAEGPSNGAYSFPFTYPTVATSVDGGLDWRARPPAKGWWINAMACPGQRACVAVGTTNAGVGGAWVTGDFGRAWEEASLPRTVQTLNSVSCPSDSACAAVGSTVAGTAVALTSSDGGMTWALARVPKGLASLASVSCATARLCVGVGSIAVHFSVPPGGHLGVGDIEAGSGALITSDDGGRTWVDRARSATRAGYVPYFFSVSCLPSGFCATGPSYGRFLSSHDGGRTWTDVKNSFGYFPTTGIACTGQSRCVASSTAQAAPPQLYLTIDGGKKWTRATVQSGLAQYAQSSWQLGTPTCSGSLCLVVGGDTWYGTPGLALVSRDAGRSWSASKLPSGSSLLIAASCTGAFYCLAATETRSGHGMFIYANLRAES